MSKIIRAMNTMIQDSEKIRDVIPGRSRIYFSFDNRHKWSIWEWEGMYYLRYYAGEEISMAKLIEQAESEAGYEKVVTYSTEDYTTEEAVQTFRELLMVVKERVYNVDKALDEIIDGLPF